MRLRTLACAVLLSLGASYALTPVATHGTLSIKNGQLVDSTGSAVILRGVSMFWSSEPDGNSFYNAGVAQTLLGDWKAAIVRVPLGIEHVKNAPTGNTSYLEDLSGGATPTTSINAQRAFNMVDICIRQGLYVILDWHAEQLHQSEAVTFFTLAAKKYGNVPNVIFETFNEPNGPGWNDLVTYHNAVIAAIRAQGAKNVVLVGSPSWSSQPNLTPAVTDPTGNVAYTLHFYAGASAHDAYRSNVTSALGMGRAVFISEWGTTSADGASNVSTGNSTTWLNLLETNKVSSCNWAVSNQLLDPSNSSSTTVQGSAALLRTASKTGSWATSDLTTSGNFVRTWLQGKQSAYTLPPSPPDTTYIPSNTLYATANYDGTKADSVASTDGGTKGMLSVASGSSASYYLNSSVDAYLSVSARVKPSSGGGTLTFSWDGTVLSTMTVPSGTSWMTVLDTFETKTKTGAHVLKIDVKGSIGALSSFTFTKMPLSYNPIPVGIAAPASLAGRLSARATASAIVVDLPQGQTWSVARLVNAQGREMARVSVVNGATQLSLPPLRSVGWVLLESGTSRISIPVALSAN